GLLISIQDAEEVPWRKDSSPEINAPGQRGRSDKRAVATEEIEIKPRRFGHMLLFTPDLERKAEFFTHALGLGVSDSVETFLRFLYAPTGSDHHIIGLGLSGSPGFQHAGFEVGSVDEVALAGQRMVEKGYINCWGTGRHGPGSNYFHYLRDPWNSIAEYFCDMDYITEGSDWEPRVWQNEDADASWGPHLPPDFLTNFEAIGR
ncbi:MAG: VOC family protein, partial [Rhodospirillales bacterium]|nr:VOC family protein [Rhodospirillales bacterium]